MRRQEEVDKITASSEIEKSSVQALQLEEQAIQELLNVVKKLQSGAFISMEDHAALNVAVRHVAELNTALQRAVSTRPVPLVPRMSPGLPQLTGTKIAETHNRV